MQEQDRDTVGVIVARFQVADLHPGHRHLIAHVKERHADVCIVLGVRHGLRTAVDPLLFEERKSMVRQAFPDQALTIIPLYDHPFSHERWSENLDEAIRTAFQDRSAVLYGSRDSFIPLYTGIFPTTEVPAIFSDSGTLIRKATHFPDTAEARAAIIYEQQTRPGIMYSTVDLAILDRSAKTVLLIGKKAHDELLSFMGGFLDPAYDQSDADAAMRERSEELLGIAIGTPMPLTDIRVDDPRYRGTPDGTKTRLFCADYISGIPTQGDDADSVHWVPIEDLTDSRVMVPWHLPLGRLVQEYLQA